MKQLPAFSKPTPKHPWHDFAPGTLEELHAIVEIPLNSRLKYEIDKESGLLKLDLALYSSVEYPANYGFIPQTLAGDGDPLDILILGHQPIYPLTLVEVRPVGVIHMIDQGEEDYKVIGVMAKDPEYKHVKDMHDLSPHIPKKLRRFFLDYKILEHKAVTVEDMQPLSHALPVITAAIEAYQKWVKG